MRTTVQAFIDQIKNVRKEAEERSARLNKRGIKRIFDVGNRISFFIPPSEKEAETMEPKHLLVIQYRGPVNVIRKLSDTMFQLEFEGKTYYR